MWLSLALLPSVAAVAEYWTAQTFPSPREAGKLCLPAAPDLRPGSVCDPDSVLTVQDAIELNSAAAAVENGTACACPEQAYCRDFGTRGFSLAVALLTSLRLKPEASEMVKNSAAKKFAKKLRERWRIGQCDDDIIIFIAVRDKKVVTSLGRTAEARVSVGELSGIHSAAHAHFSANRTAAGLALMIHRLSEILQDNPKGGLSGESGWSIPTWGIVLLVLLLVTLIAGSIAGGYTEFVRWNRVKRRPRRRAKPRQPHMKPNRKSGDDLEGNLAPVAEYGEEEDGSSDSDAPEIRPSKRPH